MKQDVMNKEQTNLLDLETKRLILRKIKQEDVNAIFECWMRDEDVSRYMFWRASDNRKDAEEFVEYELANIENEKWKRWIVVAKDTSELIGTCAIENTASAHVLEKLGFQFVRQEPYECNGGTIVTVGKRYIWKTEWKELRKRE